MGKMLLGALLVIAVAGAGVWGATALKGGPLALPGQQVAGDGKVDVRSMRDAQRYSNALFEVLPEAELLSQGWSEATSSTPDGLRYSLNFKIINLDSALSLKTDFMSVEGEGWDAAGDPVDVFAQLPWRSGASIGAGGTANGRIRLFTGRGMTGFHVTLTYDEPGRTPATADFVWPLGR
jgi:hypothetical protein